MSKALELAENLQCWDLGPIRSNAVSVKKLMENASDELTRLAGVEAELAALRKQKPAPWQPLKTSQKGRDAVATFFFDQLNRHDFTRYINSTLAAQRCFEEYVPEDAAGIKEEILRGLPKTDDRKMLEYLMQQFNFEEWNCDRCGWSESTSKCDSADLLRRYLAGDKASMRRLSKDLQDDLLAIDNFPQPSGNSEQLPDRPEDHREHPQRGLAQS